MRKFKTLGFLAVAMIFLMGIFGCVKPQPVLESISVKTPPETVEYYEGQVFDPTGMVVEAKYNDGSTKEITDYDYSPKEALTVEDDKITITYEGKSTTVDITVNAVELTGISIETQPTKKTYAVGETFDPAGMVVLAHFNDSTTETVTNYTFEPSGALTKDDTTITISYQGKTATVSISVVVQTGLEISKQPTKTTYLVGENFDATGMEVKAVYDDGSKAVVTNYQVVPSRALTFSDCELTIKQGDFSAKIAISVNYAPAQGTPISTPEDFAAINNNLSGNYYLTNDIDFGGATIDRIGHFDNLAFDGVFDGRGYALKNFIVGGGPNDGGPWGRALFGRLGANGVIKNLAVINASATGNCAAVLVGCPLGTIENVYLHGTVNNTDNAEYGRGGTIYGRMDWSLGEPVLRNIVVNVTTQGAGAYTLGGRFNPATVVENVFVVTDNLVNPAEKMATVNKQGNPVEAIAGVTTFAMADVDSIDFGALDGIWKFEAGQLPSLYKIDEEQFPTRIAVTKLPDKTIYAEGQVFDPAGMVVTAYNGEETSEVTDYIISPKGALTSEDNKVTVIYKGKKTTVDITILEGVAISTVEDFAAINNNLQGYYYLVNDIDFNGATIDRIGHFDGPGFDGIFDGNGYSLKNFVVGLGPSAGSGQVANEWGRALFGRLEPHGIIRNVAVIGGSSTGSCASLLVGQPMGTIENVYLEGTVTNNDNAEYARGGAIYGRMDWTLGKAVFRNIVANVTTIGNGAYTLGGRFNPNTVVENVFVVRDNLRNKENPNQMATLNTAGNPVGSVDGVTVFYMADIETVDFSELPSEYWYVAEGQLPVLKSSLNTPTAIEIDEGGVVTITDVNGDNASGYKLYFYQNDQLKDTLVIQNGDVINQVDLSNSVNLGACTVKVQALGGGAYLDSGISEASAQITITNYKLRFGGDQDNPNAKTDKGRWYYWNDQGWVGSNVTVNSATYNNNVLSISWTSTGSNWFGLQLFYVDPDAVVGTDYEISMTITSDRVGSITICDKVVQLQVGDNEFEVVYKQAAPAQNTGWTIAIQMGVATPASMMNAGSLQFSNIVITPAA